MPYTYHEIREAGLSYATTSALASLVSDSGTLCALSLGATSLKINRRCQVLLLLPQRIRVLAFPRIFRQQCYWRLPEHQSESPVLRNDGSIHIQDSMLPASIVLRCHHRYRRSSLRGSYHRLPHMVRGELLPPYTSVRYRTHPLCEWCRRFEHQANC